MLKATEKEIEDVREYFEWQAPDLEVTFMQKVYSEAVLNTRHDVWDSLVSPAKSTKSVSRAIWPASWGPKCRL